MENKSRLDDSLLELVSGGANRNMSDEAPKRKTKTGYEFTCTKCRNTTDKVYQDNNPDPNRVEDCPYCGETGCVRWKLFTTYA